MRKSRCEISIYMYSVLSSQKQNLPIKVLLLFFNYNHQKSTPSIQLGSPSNNLLTLETSSRVVIIILASIIESPPAHIISNHHNSPF